MTIVAAWTLDRSRDIGPGVVFTRPGVLAKKKGQPGCARPSGARPSSMTARTEKSFSFVAAIFASGSLSVPLHSHTDTHARTRKMAGRGGLGDGKKAQRAPAWGARRLGGREKRGRAVSLTEPGPW